MSPEDTDSFIDLERLVAAARRQARIVALCAAIGLALGIAYLAFTPQVYTASTNILLDDSLTRFAEDKDAPPAHIQADSMVLERGRDPEVDAAGAGRGRRRKSSTRTRHSSIRRARPSTG